MRIATYQPRLIYPDIPQINLDTYEKGLSCFIDRFLEGYSGEIAFYQFGEIKTPGVSDIDLLMVVKDENWKQARHKAQSIINSSGLLSFLFIHEPVVACESLVPCLPFLHTFENCRYLQGTWDPLAQVSIEIQDENARFMRHVVWNSFMRIATLELENSSIGLRRALILMQNLLTSAHFGNLFLIEPISISLSTKRIRDEILSASLFEQESLAKANIKQIVAVLNEVDNSLDKEFQAKMEPSSTSPVFIMSSRGRFLISPLTCLDVAKSRWQDKFLKNLRIVLVPTYQIVFVAMLARAVGDRVPQIAAFRRLSISHEILQRFSVNLFAENFKSAYHIAESYDVNNFLTMPFSHRESKLSLRKQVLQQFRRAILYRGLPKKTSLYS